MRRSSNFTAYTMLAPTLVLFVVFMVLPLIMTGTLSFRTGGVLQGFENAGFENYTGLPDNRRFTQSLRFVLIYAAIIIPVVLCFSLFLAVLLADRYRRGSTFFKTLIFFPNLAPMVTLSVMWVFMIHPEIGLINILIRNVGLIQPVWLGEPRAAMITIMLLELWRGVGFYVIVFIAGLVAIPDDIYEAGLLDGADGLKRFWYLTLPLLRPTVAFALIMAVIFNLQVFDSIFVLTRGGPAGTTTSPAYYIYAEAFRFDRFGPASTMAVVLMGMIVVVTGLLFRYFRKTDAIV